MAVKFKPFELSNKTSRWVFSINNLSSLSTAIKSQDSSETFHKVPNLTGIDPRVLYLKNRLCPHELIRVLNDTPDLKSALKLFKWASLQKQFRHTTDTYISMILKLGFTGNVDEMEGFCREMVRDRCSNVEEALVDLVDVFLKNNRLDEGMRVFLVMVSSGIKPSLGKWNVMLSALVETKRDFRDVLLIYKEMVKSRTIPSVDTLNHLIKALFNAGMVDNALDQFRRMRKKGCRPNSMTFEIVICGLLVSDRVDELLAVMNEMFKNEIDLTKSFYCHVIPLLCRENKVGEAMRLFDMMNASQFEPDIVVHESLLKCLCANNHLREATQLFRETKDRGFTPSVDVVVDIVKANCKLGNLDEARNLLDDNDVFDSSYNILLQSYCNSYYLLEAKILLCRMYLLNVIDGSSWNILIQGFCNANIVKQAYVLLGKMIVSSHLPNSATYSSLVIGNCNLCKYEDALKFFRQVRVKDMILDPDSYAKLIEGLCNIGNFQQATEVFMYMHTKNQTVHDSLFRSLIQGLCATRKVEEAIELLKFGHCFNIPVDANAYRAIMRGLFRINRPNDTLVFYSQILRRDLVLDSETCCILIQCMSALCKTKYCLLLIQWMVSEGFLPDSETLACLAMHLISQSKLHKIWIVINKMHEESEILDTALYNTLINGLWREGYKMEACQLLDSMLEKGWVPDADTHGLLIGSLGGEKKQCNKLDTMVVQDEVSSILSEGLEET